MNSKLIIAVAIILNQYLANAQQTISGSIIDNLSKPAPFVTIGLLKPDSSVIKATNTDENGRFEFQKIPN